jgi:hypothetical protein
VTIPSGTADGAAKLGVALFGACVLVALCGCGLILPLAAVGAGFAGALGGLSWLEGRR